MELFIVRLLNLNINASILVAAVLLFRVIFRKAPKWINCVMWTLVGLRLAIPFSIESKFSLIPKADPIPNGITNDLNPTFNTPVQAVNEYLTNTLATSPYDSATKTGVIFYILSLLWVTGVVIMLGYALFSTVSLRLKLRTATRYLDGVLQSDRVDFPFVIGIFRPVIYIPYSLSESDIEHVLSHERAHIRRKDHWWKPLAYLLLTINWFNPIIWLAYAVLCKDIESACDEKVISELDGEARRKYSVALLNCSTNRRITTVCPVAFGETGVKSRVRYIMNYKKPAFWIVVVALVVSAGVAVCFMTYPKKEIQVAAGLSESTTKDVSDDVSDDEFVVPDCADFETVDFTLPATQEEDQEPYSLTISLCDPTKRMKVIVNTENEDGIPDVEIYED